MGDSSASGPDSRPKEGDIVVAGTTDMGARYTIRQVPGEPQITASTRERALQIGRRFARQYGVDLWFAGGMGLRLVESHRGMLEAPSDPLRGRPSSRRTE
jgi:hypothetical protein